MERVTIMSVPKLAGCGRGAVVDGTGGFINKFIYIILLINCKMETPALHMPRLDTVLMVEDTLEKLDYYPTKNQLWRALPKMVMWQTFNIILDYLTKSNKIIIDKKGEIVLVFADNPKVKKLLAKSVPYKNTKK